MMSEPAVHQLLEDGPEDPLLRLLLVALAHYAYADGDVHIGQRRLSQITGFSSRQLRSLLSRASRDGWIKTVENGTGAGPSVHRLLWIGREPRATSRQTRRKPARARADLGAKRNTSLSLRRSDNTRRRSPQQSGGVERWTNDPDPAAADCPQCDEYGWYTDENGQWRKCNHPTLEAAQ